MLFSEKQRLPLFLKNCEFVDCIFSNVDSGFTLENTKIGHFSQFFEEETAMDYHIKQMLERQQKYR